MSCAIDTNIILDLVAGDEPSSKAAASVLEIESQRNGLVISPPVYAECLAHPGWRQSDLDRLLRDTRIAVDWVVDQRVWLLAGSAFARYANQRRQQGTSQPRRLLADFIIGAHGVEAGGLITRDPFFGRYFSELRLVAPRTRRP